jgi:hypothetical protein
MGVWYVDDLFLLWMFVGCNLTASVILFDEADIFLEQRSTANLERNILVSGKSSTLA